MEFDFTQMNRTLKKVLEGEGIEPAVKKLIDWYLVSMNTIQKYNLSYTG